jgi:hypothetical protein
VGTLKPTFFACLVLLMAAPPALAGTYAADSPAGPGLHAQQVRFGGFGRSRGFGRSPGIGRGRYGYRSRRGPGIFRRIVRAIAIGYLLHLLFTTPGGLIVLVFMIAGFALLVSRFRRRRVLRY